MMIVMYRPRVLAALIKVVFAKMKNEEKVCLLFFFSSFLLQNFKSIKRYTFPPLASRT
jgi:hypothetical protein